MDVGQEEIEDKIYVNPDADSRIDNYELSEQDQWLLALCETKEGKLEKAIAQNSPRLTEYTEIQIREYARPTQTDQLIRVAFWDEVNNAANEGRKFNQKRCYQGICSLGYWQRIVRELDWKMTYILQPIKDYQTTNKLLVAKGQQVMLDILNADPYCGKTGKTRKLDARIAKIQLDVYKMVVERTFGKSVERKQIHTTTGDQQPANLSDQKLSKEIDIMKTELDGSILSIDEVINVEK